MPTPRVTAAIAACLLTGTILTGCGGSGTSARSAPPVTATATAPTSPAPAGSATPSAAPSSARPTHRPARRPTHRPVPAPPAGGTLVAGNAAGHATVPADARAADTSHPTRVVGDGTPAGCTSAAVVDAVAAGGVITFRCGPRPVVITMTATAKVRNAVPDVVIDGGGMVTLSGGGRRRILYMDTCDQAQGWTTSHCQNQAEPRLTVQNLTFSDGNSTGDHAEGGGGGAILVRGGRFKAVHDRFTGNRCDPAGPDLGGAAIRVLDQYQGLPVDITDSTFEGGVCSNGGALSSIGVSWNVVDSVLTGNEAVGRGANPARSGTSGGGSGGAVYTDGDRYAVRLAGTLVTRNTANEGGGALFYVSNDRTGTLTLDGSTLTGNVNRGFATAGYPGIFFLGAGKPAVSGSVLR